MAHLRFCRLALLPMLALLALQALGQESRPATKSVKARAGAFFGNEVCPVTGRAVDQRHFANKRSERIYVADAASVAKVKEDWRKHLLKAYPKTKLKKLNLSVCPMMPHKKPKSRFFADFQGQRIPLCCKKCVRNFSREGQRWLNLANDATLTDLDNDKCLIHPDKDVENDCFFIVGKTLVGASSDRCLAEFNRDPKKFEATLKKAVAAKKKKDAERRRRRASRRGDSAQLGERDAIPLSSRNAIRAHERSAANLTRRGPAARL